MIRSLRLRLLFATSLSTATVLALLGVAIYGAMWRLLLRDYDAALLAQARAIAATAEQREGRIHLEFDPRQLPEFSAGERPEYFEAWLDGGRVLRRSDSLGGADLPRTVAEARAGAGKLRLPGTRHGRAVVMTFTPREEGRRDRAASSPPRTCTIAVAGTPFEAWRMLGYLGWLLLTLCSTAIVLSGAILLRVVSRGVRPVRELATNIGAVRESDLAYRISDARVPVELAPVVERLNGLLDRLEKAFGRETAFTADVAHELRTPLAGLMTTLEVCRLQPRDPAEYEATIDECRAVADRMQAMVENLLMLSRADSGHLAVSQQRSDVVELLHECWSLFAERAGTRRLHVRWRVADECQAKTDPAKLRIVIQNLLDNAVSYVNEAGAIRISAARQGEMVMIEIANSGSAVAASDAARVFDRLWRGDASRSETGVHCGLGLSLSQRLVNLLGGQIAVETTLGGEFVARLSLPTPRDDDPAATTRPSPHPAAIAAEQWSAPLT